jgi:hypothetical protein
MYAVNSNYFLAVSFLAESTLASPALAVESTAVAESFFAVSTLAESALAESAVDEEPAPLQAAKEVAIAKATKPNLNEFFILRVLICLIFFDRFGC